MNYRNVDERPCSVEGCKKTSKCRDRYCSMHASRYRKTGSVGIIGCINTMNMTFEEKLFYRRRICINNCWEWTGYRDKDGYGKMTTTLIEGKNKPYGVHRISAMVFKGFDILSNLLVCHKCDNPSCFNPEHLFIGTPKKNYNDSINKGRMRYALGEDAGNSKLNNNDIYKIRNLYEKGERQSSIAKIFNINKSQVSKIVNMKGWKHLSLH